MSKDSNAYGGGQPWKYRPEVNTKALSTELAWSTTGSLPYNMVGFQTVVTKNRVYLLGGYNSSRIYTASIKADGTLGGWLHAGNLPFSIEPSQVVVFKNNVYLFGNHKNNKEYTEVYATNIYPDGELSVWHEVASLPKLVTNASCVVIKNRIYLIGGTRGHGAISPVYSTYIDDDGFLDEWALTSILPVGVYDSEAVVTKNKVYLLGGLSEDGCSDLVQVADLNDNGEARGWRIDSRLPAPVARGQAVVIKNKVYLIDGFNTNNIYISTINEDGTLGKWESGGSLGFGHVNSKAIVTRNRIYLFSCDFDALIFSAQLYAKEIKHCGF